MVSIYKLVFDSHKRIEVTHFLLVFILSINILLFTQNNISIMIQLVLIVAIILHNKDDKILKETLEETESKLREDASIFDRNIIVSESDLQGRITYANQNFCDISGFTKEELLGEPHSILRSPDESKDLFAKLWSTIQSGETFHGIIKNKKKNGDAYWVDASIVPIRSKNKIVAYKAIRIDITDKVLAREKFKSEITHKDTLLEKQTNRFEFAINSSRDGFWDLNVESQDFYLSAGWKKRLGFSEEEKITYLDYLSLMPDKYRVEHHNAMNDVVDNYPNHVENIHFRIRYPLITKSGERLLIEDVGDAFFGSNDEILKRITGFHRDITEQERQTKMIESQNRVAAMGDMMGNIAHQWRQPIGAINNVLNELEFDIELEDLEQVDSKRFLKISQKVKEYTSHLSKTIDDFRQLTSDEKVKTDFFLIDVMKEAYSIVEDEYKQHNIAFEILIEEEDYICKLNGYKRELLQVIINILNNAKDIFLEKEINNAKVFLELEKNDREVLLSIQDNAGGIPNTIIEKIFDPYFTTKHESVGTGIGLFMSKKIIIEHFDGVLSVSNENNGAKFLVSLPITE